MLVDSLDGMMVYYWVDSLDVTMVDYWAEKRAES